MSSTLLANLFYEVIDGRTVLRAMPVLLAVLCVLAPAYRFEDGQNYDPTNKWVLFGHHFAAIAGAGPLIGPVLAIQYGYMPGLLWLVVGVCLAGAGEGKLLPAPSVPPGGKSLAQ